MNGTENGRKRTVGSLAQELRHVLDSAKGEREVHQFLKEHQSLVVDTFNRAWNHVECIPEFWLGSEFRCDFLILSADSCAWNVTFIELKSPLERLYLKHGTPSKHLRIAQKEIADVKDWFRTNQAYLRSCLANMLKKKDVPAHCSHADSHADAFKEILDPQTFVRDSYYIVIGRRSSLTRDEQHRRAMTSNSSCNTVATYDRLLDTATRQVKRVDDPP